MRELDWTIAIVGGGRLGTALATALSTPPPYGRGSDPDADVVVLAVPDQEIVHAARVLRPGRLVGHCSGATTLAPLVEAGHEAFSVHPLMTVPHGGQPDFRGAGGAVAGSTERAREVARAIAERLGLETVEVADEDRAAYHAAAAIASNFLTTLEGSAERLAETAGVPRRLLVPLVRASVEAWSELGARDALTGPFARGDEETIAKHRATIAGRTPELLPLWEELATATRRLASA